MSETFAVAVKGIIKNPENKYLILYKSDLEDMNPNDFDIPGGRIRRGEKLEDALVREIQEETGLNITIERVSKSRGFTKGDLHLVGTTFLVYCENFQVVELSHEHTAFRRKTKEEILEGEFPTRLQEEFKNI